LPWQLAVSGRGCPASLKATFPFSLSLALFCHWTRELNWQEEKNKAYFLLLIQLSHCLGQASTSAGGGIACDEGEPFG